MARVLPPHMCVASMYIQKKDLAFLRSTAKKLGVTKSQYIRQLIAGIRLKSKKKK